MSRWMVARRIGRVRRFAVRVGVKDGGVRRAGIFARATRRAGHARPLRGVEVFGRSAAERRYEDVAGGRASRTYRRAYRPPNGLSRNFDGLARFDGEHLDVDSFLTLCYPAGGNDSYPYTAGGYGFQNPTSSVESPARRGPRMPLRGAGSSVPPECNVPRPGRKLLRRRGVGRAASIRFEGSSGGRGALEAWTVSDW